ncbi:MAG: DALR anticodon-binding domain-containing protein, partial [bacterium]
ELMDEVGIDAARFFFLLRRVSSPLDFDLELAKSHSEDNPVYYVQYAHARIASILRQPQLKEMLGEDPPQFQLLIEPEERLIMRQFAYFSWTLASVVRTYEPHPVVLYLLEMARLFHLYYQRHRVITSDKSLTKARVTLCKAVKNVLRVGLGLIGVEAPERM